MVLVFALVMIIEVFAYVISESDAGGDIPLIPEVTEVETIIIDRDNVWPETACLPSNTSMNTSTQLQRDIDDL